MSARVKSTILASAILFNTSAIQAAGDRPPNSFESFIAFISSIPATIVGVLGGTTSTSLGIDPNKKAAKETVERLQVDCENYYAQGVLSGELLALIAELKRDNRLPADADNDAAVDAAYELLGAL